MWIKVVVTTLLLLVIMCLVRLEENYAETSIGENLIYSIEGNKVKILGYSKL